MLLSQANAAVGSVPRFALMLRLRKENGEVMLLNGDATGAASLARATLALVRGKAQSVRFYIYPLFLLLAEAELSGLETHSAERVGRLLGASNSIAERLGLVVPERTEWERATRLRTRLTEQLGQDSLAAEEAVGATLDDEAALEFALMPI